MGQAVFVLRDVVTGQLHYWLDERSSLPDDGSRSAGSRVRLILLAKSLPTALNLPCKQDLERDPPAQRGNGVPGCCGNITPHEEAELASAPQNVSWKPDGTPSCVLNH